MTATEAGEATCANDGGRQRGPHADRELSQLQTD